MPPDLRPVRDSEMTAAAAVLGRGMRDNPLHARVFGADADRREIELTRFFQPVLERLARTGRILGAFQDETIVAVCALAAPGGCQPTLLDKLRIARAFLVETPTSTTAGLVRWAGAWSRRDWREPHWHLGPLAVDRRLQGRGIGRALLDVCCGSIDADGAAMYLETDKIQNVAFYERAGFAVAARADVLGVPNWFMHRRAAPNRSSSEVQS